MAELKCPHCGQAFTVDDTELSSILQQIRDKEFKKDLEKRISELKEHMMMTHRLEMEAKENEIKLMSQKEYDKEIQKLKSQLDKATEKSAKLQAQLESSEDKKIIAVMEAVKKVEEEKKDLESQLIHEKDKGKLLLEQKDEQIAYYRDLKTKMSTKMVGETLEQHCEIQFNQLRATAFRNAYFEKDNDSRSGSKGDYIYRETDENGVELISIMFEMEIGGMFRRDAGQNAPLLRHKTKGKSRIMNQNQAKEYYKKLFVNYPDVLSVEEATTLLGFKSQTAIIRRIHQHRIRCLKVGRSFMIPKEYLIDYLLDS